MAARPDLRDVATVAAFAIAVGITVLQPVWGRDRHGAAAVVDVVAARQSQTPALIQAGDTLIIHPPWRDDIAMLARSRLTLPAGTIVTEGFTRRHGDPWPAVVVVAEGVHGWSASLEERRRSLGVAVEDVDGVRLFRLPADAGPATVAPIERARVVVVDRTGRTIPCPWNGQRRRHVCVGLPQWMTVGPDTLAIGGTSESCIWAHPISGGRVVIDFGAVDTNRGLTLQAALTDAAASNATGAAVTYSLDVGGTQTALTVHRQTGFQTVTIPQRPGKASTTLTVTTVDDGQRHTCFRLGAP